MMMGLATGGVAVAFSTCLTTLSLRHCCSWAPAASTMPREHSTCGKWGLTQGNAQDFRHLPDWRGSLAGLWPLSGFWSKDAILSNALDKQPILFVLVIITVFMTAFYMFRVIFMTFGGEYRGKEHHLHESSSVMTIPLFILAALAIASGWVNLNGGFSSFFGTGTTHSVIEGLFGIFKEPLPWISLILALAGIFLAYAIYSKKWVSAAALGKTFAIPYKVLYNKLFCR